MKGNEKVIETLNALLADELTAVSQYMVHSEMCANWGYNKLHQAIEKRAIDEMKHAEKLIGRILFLEGLPIVSRLNPMHIGADVAAQLGDDQDSERGAVAAYNEAIGLCAQSRDAGSREMLEDILEDEEAHIDWLETQIGQMQQLGMSTYLLAQIG